MAFILKDYYYADSKIFINEPPRCKQRGIKVTIPPCGGKNVLKNVGD